MFPSMLLLGFFLGVRHALEADHVTAVAALATRTSSRRGLLRLAAGWGAGHTATILAAGALVIALGATIPEGSEALFDRLVGPLLVVMGFGVIRRARARHAHVHVHEHYAGARHVHVHLHEAPTAAAHDHEHSSRGTARALAMGTLHGLAGSGALLLLVLPQAKSGLEAMAYLAVFGAGSVAGMMLFSLALSFPLRLASRFAGASAGLEGALGALTIVVGLRLLGR